MKITKTQLKQIIREELAEGDEWYDPERGYETVADRKYADQQEAPGDPSAVLENALAALEEEGHYLGRHIREGIAHIYSNFQRLSDEWVPETPEGQKYKDDLDAVLGSAEQI